MTRRITVLALLASAATGLAALAAPGTTPTVDDLVARHIAARGGYERLKAVQSARFSRIYGGFSSNVPVVITRKRPNFMRVEQKLADGRMVVRGVNATTAWDRGPDGKVTERSPEWATETREIDADFDGLLVDAREKGHAVSYVGSERVAGVDTHKLQVTLKSGARRTVFLDAATFLERKQVGTMTMPPAGKEKAEVVLTFADYREVGGLEFPFAIDEERNAFPVQTLAIYTESIELNVPVEDAAFEKPAQ